MFAWRMPSKEELEKKHIIAYIDVLGVRSALKENDYELFKEMYTSMDIAQILSAKKQEGKTNSNKPKFKGFSDNMLIAIELKNDSITEFAEAFSMLSMYLKVFTIALLKKGRLIRGTISFGDLYIDDLIVWGKSLVEVVEMEETVAFFPRIIIANEVIERLKQNAICETDLEFERTFGILKDSDGYYFINIVDYNSLKYTRDLIEETQKIIKEKIGKCDDKKILQKLTWYDNYLSRALAESFVADDETEGT